MGGQWRRNPQLEESTWWDFLLAGKSSQRTGVKNNNATEWTCNFFKNDERGYRKGQPKCSLLEARVRKHQKILWGKDIIKKSDNWGILCKCRSDDHKEGILVKFGESKILIWETNIKSCAEARVASQHECRIWRPSQ